MKDPRKIIIAPILSEKAERLKEKYNQYVFRVDRNANKIEIKYAVEKRFDVKVKNVRTMIVARKTKARFTRSGYIEGKTSSWKKAIVTLADGYQIDLLENV